MDVKNGEMQLQHNLEDEGIYVFDEADGEDSTLIDLQLELAIVKKRLKATELAYRALENEYISIRESNNLALVVFSEVEFTESYASKGRAGGILAVQDLIAQVRKDLGQLSDIKIQLVWHSDKGPMSRDFIDGFTSLPNVLDLSGSTEKLIDFVPTLFRLPQVKRVYISMASEVTANLLLRVIKEVIEGRHTITLPSPDSSPSMRRKRSWTGASSLSNLSRNQSIADCMLSKFYSLISSKDDQKSKKIWQQIKESALSTYENHGDIVRELQDLDFDTLLTSLECPNILYRQMPPTPPAVPEPIQIEPPTVKPAEVAVEVEVEKEAEKPVAIEPPENSGWAEVVRRGRSNRASEAQAPTSPSVPTTPLPAAIAAFEPPTPTSPVNEKDGSPSRNRRNRGGVSSKKKEEAKQNAVSIPALRAVELDPNAPLCKQKKPPCNQYFLTKKGCTNPKCIYSHTYRLSPAQLDEMRYGASRTPCVYRKTQQVCMGGEECVFGHVCPQGKRCKQGNRCQFPAHMH